jgi:DNA polymerase V
VWGIGRRLGEQITALGINTVADFTACDRMRIAKRFGVGGCRLYDELREQMVWLVGQQTDTGKQTITSSRSFRHTSTDATVVFDAISYHLHQAAAELRANGYQCRYLQVVARPSRHGDWVLRRGSGECILVAPTNDTRLLLQEARHLFTQFYDPEVPYKKAGVTLGWFSETSHEQPDLFGAVADTVEDAVLLETVDQLNQRFGSEVVSVGRTPGAGAWAPARDLLSPKYTTNWADLATVKA